ncbi:MAG: hypothetical protein J7L95_06580 [Prolixibacteraceae bacterium]|nr:hypothetical protein [Prolixibacteraceae bacterium]
MAWKKVKTGIFKLIYAKEFEKAAIEASVNGSFIAESCRRDLLKRQGTRL